MLGWSNTTNAGLTRPTAIGDHYVAGNGSSITVFASTSQDLYINDSGNVGTVSTESTRSATTCYIRGLSEHLRIQTNTGLPWYWRRIVFTAKDAQFLFLTGQSGEIQQPRAFIDSSAGMGRSWFNITLNNNNARVAAFESTLFRGVAGTDWNDALTATVDTRRVTLKYDKTVMIKSGNASGALTSRKLWHPYNSNLVYDDDENGGAENSSYSSVTSKAGGGDMIVVDYIVPGVGGTASDLLALKSSSTLYWHEK